MGPGFVSEQLCDSCSPILSFLVTKMGESGKVMVRMFLDKASGLW